MVPEMLTNSLAFTGAYERNSLSAGSSPLPGKPIAFRRARSDASRTSRGLGLPGLAANVTVPPVA